MAEIEYQRQSVVGGDSRGNTYIKAGILISIGIFLALVLVTDSAKTAATVMLLFVFVGTALFIGWLLGHKSATRAMQIQADTLMPFMTALPQATQYQAQQQISAPSPARALLPSANTNPPIAPSFERQKQAVRIMITNGTFQEVDTDLLKYFIDECFPDCNRERWRHENEDYGYVARVMCQMQSSPLVEQPPNRFKWQSWVTRDELDNWYARVLEAGRF